MRCERKPQPRWTDEERQVASVGAYMVLLGANLSEEATRLSKGPLAQRSYASIRAKMARLLAELKTRR